MLVRMNKNNKFSEENSHIIVVDVPCLKCKKSVSLIKVDNVFKDPVYINLPGYVCSECIHAILDEIPDPPGLVGFSDLSLAIACDIVENYQFSIDIDGSVIFFCRLFEDCQEIYLAGAKRFLSEGLPETARIMIDGGIEMCEKNDMLIRQKKEAGF